MFQQRCIPITCTVDDTHLYDMAMEDSQLQRCASPEQVDTSLKLGSAPALPFELESYHRTPETPWISLRPTVHTSVVPAKVLHYSTNTTRSKIDSTMSGQTNAVSASPMQSVPTVTVDNDVSTAVEIQPLSTKLSAAWSDWSVDEKEECRGVRLPEPRLGKNAWFIQGRLQDLYREKLEGVIANLIRVNHKKIFSKSMSGLVFSPVILSASEDSSEMEPTILILTADIDLGHRAKRCIQQSRRYQTHRHMFRIEVDHRDLLHPAMNASLSGQDHWRHPVFGSECGSLACIQTLHPYGNSTWIYATCGGIIRIQGISHALMAAHCLDVSEQHESLSNIHRHSSDQSRNSEVYDESDSTSESSTDYEDISSDDEIEIEDPQLRQRESSGKVRPISQDLVIYIRGRAPRLENSLLASRSLPRDEICQPTFLARVRSGDTTSVGAVSRAMVASDSDWGIVLVEDPRFEHLNRVEVPGKGEIIIRHVSRRGHTCEGTMYIAGGISGVKEVSILETLSSYVFPWSSRVHEVLCINTSIVSGDSGAWVFDDSGYLYGIAVATVPALSVTYLLRAEDVFRDIIAQEGIDVQLDTLLASQPNLWLSDTLSIQNGTQPHSGTTSLSDLPRSIEYVEAGSRDEHGYRLRRRPPANAYDKGSAIPVDLTMRSTRMPQDAASGTYESVRYSNQSPSQILSDTPHDTSHSILVRGLGQLRNICLEFCMIPKDSFEQCRNFVEESPQIVTEEAPKFQNYVNTALKLYTAGHERVAQQVVQRVVMLKHLHDDSRTSSKSRAAYFKNLRAGGSDLVDHQKIFDTVWDAVQRRAQSSSAISQATASPNDLARPQSNQSNIVRTNDRRLSTTGRTYHQREYVVADTRLNPSSNTERQFSVSQASAGDQSSPALNARFAPGIGNPNINVSQPPNSSGQIRPHTVPRRSGEDEEQVSNASLSNFRQSEPRTGLVPNNPSRPVPEFRTVFGKEAFEGFVSGLVVKKRICVPWGNNLKGGQNEPADTDTNTRSGFSSTSEGERFLFKHLFLLVVITKYGYSICCPISTYGGQGLAKRGNRPDGNLNTQEISAHVIIYSQGQKPAKMKGEPDLPKRPLTVRMRENCEPLHPASRVHFGKSHTLEWNDTVVLMGNLIPEDVERAHNYFLIQMDPKLTSVSRR